MLTLLVSTATELPAWTQNYSFYNSLSPVWVQVDGYYNDTSNPQTPLLHEKAYTQDVCSEFWSGFGLVDWDPIGWSTPFQNIKDDHFETGVARSAYTLPGETWVLEWEKGGMYGEEAWSSNGLTVTRTRDMSTYLGSRVRKL